MRVDIEKILKIEEERAKINRLNFREIEWYENGKKIDIPSRIKSEWETTGLNNVDFVLTGYIYWKLNKRSKK